MEKQFVGTWQTGTTVATRKRLKLQAGGQYSLTVSGTIADTGAVSATNGQIELISKNNPQPTEVTYTLADGILVTQGTDPFDGTKWHKLVTSRPVRSSDSDSDSGPGIGQKFKNGFNAVRRFF